jgi:hypothetical protein
MRDLDSFCMFAVFVATAIADRDFAFALALITPTVILFVFFDPLSAAESSTHRTGDHLIHHRAAFAALA